MLQLSGYVARDSYRNLLLPSDVAAAASNDAELSKIFTRFAIAGSAPLPFITTAPFTVHSLLRGRGDDDDFESEVRNSADCANYYYE
jgi:hypothetical protein